jgi:hypothetical protein
MVLRLLPLMVGGVLLSFKHMIDNIVLLQASITSVGWIVESRFA